MVFFVAGFRFFGDDGLVADAKVKLNLSIPTTTHGYPDGITPANGELGRDIERYGVPLHPGGERVLGATRS